MFCIVVVFTLDSNCNVNVLYKIICKQNAKKVTENDVEHQPWFFRKRRLLFLNADRIVQHQTEPTEHLDSSSLACNQLNLKESEWDSSLGSVCWGNWLYSLHLSFRIVCNKSEKAAYSEWIWEVGTHHHISLVENDQPDTAKLPQGLSYKRRNTRWRKTNSKRQQVVPVINDPQGLKINGLSLSRFSHIKPALTEWNRARF